MKRNLLFLLAAVVLFLMPNGAFGQTAPNLGTTSTFALFTAGGAFASTGASNVTGDVGTNAGSFTAFPPGILVGLSQKHVVDATSAQAKIDVLAAYGALNQGGTAILVGLGGQTLTSGIYTTGAAAATLNGVLTLDAQGDPTAIFIIRIGGTFAEAGASNVNLINSASPNNVYWQIGGQFDLADGSFFKGTAIVNGAINLLGTSSFIGRGLSTAGAINIAANTVTLGAPPAAPTVTLTQPTCSVGTGTITITAPTGVGMTYSIDGSTYTNTTGVFSSLASGTYNVTAMNSDGYVSLRTTVTINAQPSPPANATASVTIQPTCSVTTGTIVVTVHWVPDMNIILTVEPIRLQ